MVLVTVDAVAALLETGTADVVTRVSRSARVDSLCMDLVAVDEVAVLLGTGTDEVVTRVSRSARVDPLRSPETSMSRSARGVPVV